MVVAQFDIKPYNGLALDVELEQLRLLLQEVAGEE